MGQGGRRRCAGGGSPAAAKHAWPAPGGTGARAGREPGRPGPDPLPRRRLTYVPRGLLDKLAGGRDVHVAIILNQPAEYGVDSGIIVPDEVSIRCKRDLTVSLNQCQAWGFALPPGSHISDRESQTNRRCRGRLTARSRIRPGVFGAISEAVSHRR
jgi:hypothetical protein